MSAFDSRTLPPHFWAKVVTDPSGCWLWTAALNSRGYPCFAISDRSQLAHRVAYQALVGPIPAGLEIDHLCRVPRCVNPAHLEPVTREENLRREMAATRPTHCPKGHEYTEANSIIKRQRNGWLNRLCRACEVAARPAKNARQRRAHAARSAA